MLPTRPAHGTERNRQMVTKEQPTHTHEHTHVERYCETCGWVECDSLTDHILCPGCHTSWSRSAA